MTNLPCDLLCLFSLTPTFLLWLGEPGRTAISQHCLLLIVCAHKQQRDESYEQGSPVKVTYYPQHLSQEESTTFLKTNLSINFHHCHKGIFIYLWSWQEDTAISLFRLCLPVSFLLLRSLIKCLELPWSSKLMQTPWPQVLLTLSCCLAHLTTCSNFILFIYLFLLPLSNISFTRARIPFVLLDYHCIPDAQKTD